MKAKEIITLSVSIGAIVTILSFGKDALEIAGFKSQTPIDRIEEIEAKVEGAVDYHNQLDAHHAAEQVQWDQTEATKDSSRRKRTQLVEALVIDQLCTDTTRTDQDLARLRVLDDCKEFGARE